MAGTFVATGAYSNLTRLELEQLRKADFFAGRKALTVGDSALPPEGVVGPGNINAEPYLTGQFTPITDLLLGLNPQPGIDLFTQFFSGGAAASITVSGTFVTVSGLTGIFGGPGNFLSISGAANPANNGTFQITQELSNTEVVVFNANATTDANNGSIAWRCVYDTNTFYGPTLLGGGEGSATGNFQWTDFQSCFDSSGGPGTPSTIPGFGVLPGDLLIVKNSVGGGSHNEYSVSTIASILNSPIVGLTFQVTHNNGFVNGSGPNTFVSGQVLEFASQPGVYYKVQSASSPDFSLTTVYSGTTNGATTATTPTSLTLNNVNNSFGQPGTPTHLHVDTDNYLYIVVRPNAVQLFAVPGSGATGNEQTFLAVVPGSGLHNNLAPTTDQVNADRVLNVVPGQYGLNSTVDRADSVFPSPGPQTTVDLLGYRIVLYPDNGSGTGPNLAAPIATLNPVIDPSIPSTDQRFTVDYSAGAIRFSCEPQIGGQIKVSGGVNATTGRLNLYAVFWAVNPSFAPGASTSLYVPQVGPFGVPVFASRTYWNNQLSTWAFDNSTGQYLVTVPLDSTIVQGGQASVSSFTTPLATITGLTGMYETLVGGTLLLAGANHAGNNGTFLIDTWISNSSVQIINPNAQAGDSHNGSISWTAIGIPVSINTLDVADATTSIVKRLNAEYVLTCGDGNVSFGDFNGTDAIDQAFAYWSARTFQAPSVTIRVKHGTYTLLSASRTIFGGNEVILVGDGKTSTIINAPSGAFDLFNVNHGGQVTFQDLSFHSAVIGNNILFINGSVRGRKCFFGGITIAFSGISAALYPLQVSTNLAPVDIAGFEDCEFDFSGAQGGGNITFTANNSPNGFVWRSCTFIGNGPPIFAFTSTSTFAEWSEFLCDRCIFQLVGVGSTSISGTHADFFANVPGTTSISVTDPVTFTDAYLTALLEVSGSGVGINNTFAYVTNILSATSLQTDQYAAFTGAVISSVTNVGGQFNVILTGPSFLGTGDQIVITGVTGTMGVHINNITWTITLQSPFDGSVFTLNGSTFAGVYSGGPGAVSDAFQGNVHWTLGPILQGPSGIMTVDPAGNDLKIEVTEVTLQDCNVISSDTTSKSLVYLHLFPLNYQTPLPLARARIGTVTIRGGIWEMASGRGNDFVPFFLMCSNPIIENVLMYSGATAVNSGPAGTYGVGQWTGAMQYAMTGGPITFAQFGFTIAASGAALSASEASGMVVRNLELRHFHQQQLNGDLLLIGTRRDQGVTDVNGVLVTDIAVATGINGLPAARIGISAGSNYSGQTVVSGTNGTVGTFRGISWLATNNLPTLGSSYVDTFGSSAILGLNYMGDLSLEDVSILPLQCSSGGHQEVLLASAIQVFNLFQTFFGSGSGGFSPKERGDLRIHNLHCNNMGGVVNGYLGSSGFTYDAVVVLSDFANIELSECHIYANLGAYSNAVTKFWGISIAPQFTDQTGYIANCSIDHCTVRVDEIPTGSNNTYLYTVVGIGCFWPVQSLNEFTGGTAAAANWYYTHVSCTNNNVIFTTNTQEPAYVAGGSNPGIYAVNYVWFVLFNSGSNPYPNLDFKGNNGARVDSGSGPSGDHGAVAFVGTSYSASSFYPSTYTCNTIGTISTATTVPVPLRGMETGYTNPSIFFTNGNAQVHNQCILVNLINGNFY